ncbi:MAG TPA: LamG-like jellyroll fold domain-containing protein [Bryobacteraceae bacterium]|nr:LamG-like jellyroll fold domain-containing protein [Bryobacteraceae bacterium]
MPFRKIWHFNNLKSIDGIPVTVLGHPKIVDTEHGKAVQFNGVDDALFLKAHPMVGAEKWTWEVVFRPDVGGNAEQRFFHFQEKGTENRLLFEIRVIGDQWCLDSFAKGGEGSKALMDRSKLHPLGKWYRVATVYDGKELKNYVDGVLEGSGEVKLEPLKAGGTSVGVRYTKVDYFKGAVLLSRTTAKALAPSEFLELTKPRQ